MKFPVLLLSALAACTVAQSPHKAFIANSEYLSSCLSRDFCREAPASAPVAVAVAKLPDPCAPGLAHAPEQCPLLDDDGDGIVNRDDRCPLEKGPAASFGCPPPPDRDGDGIADADDLCPDVPGIASEKGCPAPPALAKIAAGRIDLDGKVFFDTGKATIQERSYRLLDDVAALLVANPHVSPVLIAGHTDNRGPAALNRKLSGARAEAVKAYLTQRNVDASRLQAKGFGPDKPAQSNKTASGREANRRVEFLIGGN